MSTPSLDKAFQAVPRKLFLPADQQGYAHLDIPLPIGYGQTNSQPSTVKQMLIWLDVQPGQRVLDVGAGSGWTCALLRKLVGDSGMVHVTERVPELVHFAHEHINAANIGNVVLHQAKTDEYGWPDAAPYDRILVSAAARELPKELLTQLKIGGKLVIPIQNSIWLINKHSDDEFSTQEHPGYVFVPLV